ncbi:hypothetical protein ACH5RR_029856 [Cinchona calisaya]|uniref:Uncharacterized protein n=1 Tax=Cinchona calisaya TaxID=153742 RepID=A0ABD2YSV5_9GENT
MFYLIVMSIRLKSILRHGIVDESDVDPHGDDDPSWFTMMTTSHTPHAFRSGSAFDHTVRPSHEDGFSDRARPLHGARQSHSDHPTPSYKLIIDFDINTPFLATRLVIL